MTYGQVDLQQHCLDFIEGCTAVRWQVMGEHGVGYPRVQGARGIAGGQGNRAPKDRVPGGWERSKWYLERRGWVTGRGRLGGTAVPGDWHLGWGMLECQAGMAPGCV